MATLSSCEGTRSSVYGYYRGWMQLSSREELTCTFITWLKETEAEEKTGLVMNGLQGLPPFFPLTELL